MTCALMYSSLLSAKICRAIMQLLSRIHRLSPSDNPSMGRAAGRKGTPARPLSIKECKKLDNTLCGGPATRTDYINHDENFKILAMYLIISNTSQEGKYSRPSELASKIVLTILAKAPKRLFMQFHIKQTSYGCSAK